jgi:hypothetical protein|tara:strand:+ start:15856 stop:16311 length:456 start_codon:yes stop_codon:yes gene_type:complete
MKKLFLILFFLNSCSFVSDDNEIPKDLISEQEMIDIIYDMSLISVSKGINKRILENNGMKPKKYILNKYGIDSLQFVLSNEYYSKDLEKYLSIYENVLQKLEINRQSIVDSIENYRKDRAKRSKEINQEEKKKNKLSDPKASELNSKILKN